MTFISLIEHEFLSSVYSESLDCTDEMKLCLVRSKRLAKYCLCVFEFNSKESVSSQVKKARASIRRKLKANPLFRGVGAYIVFVNSSIDGLSVSDLPVDMTGFHIVIVQVELDTGRIVGIMALGCQIKKETHFQYQIGELSL